MHFQSLALSQNLISIWACFQISIQDWRNEIFCWQCTENQWIIQKTSLTHFFFECCQLSHFPCDKLQSEGSVSKSAGISIITINWRLKSHLYRSRSSKKETSSSCGLQCSCSSSESWATPNVKGERFSLKSLLIHDDLFPSH